MNAGRAVKCLAALLLGWSLPAVAQDGYAAFVISQGMAQPPYTVALGTTFALPNVSVLAGSESVTRYEVTITVIGGCGTLNGATSVQVEVLRGTNAFLPLGTPPPFLATKTGACYLRPTHGSNGPVDDLRIDVYDPQSIRLEAEYPVVSIARGDIFNAVNARVVDAAGHPVSGKRVRVDVDPRHCAMLGQIETSTSSTTASNGVAYFEAVRVPANAPVGDCSLTATLAETGQTTFLGVLVYDRAKVSLTATQQSLATFTGEYFQVDAQVRDEFGRALPRTVLEVRDSRAPRSSAGIEPMSTTYVLGSTNDDGGYQFAPRGNAFPGRYELVVNGPAHEVRIPVVQSVRGQPAPPPIAPPARSVSDMWWGGSTQNGWGMSIVQHGQTMFSVIYAYRYGIPEWYVMPGGAWDAVRTRYSGPIYRPRGTPFYSYDASRLEVSAPIGYATIAFGDADHANLDVTLYTEFLRGTFDTKALERQAFGAGSSSLTGLSDMWWGGLAQNGWGISIFQQQGTLFAVWYTYDDSGKATWYVMPGGSWTAADTYEGRMYSTRTDSSWIGGYDPRSLLVTDVGSYRIRFNTGDTATFEYTIGVRSGTLSLGRQPF